MIFTILILIISYLIFRFLRERKRLEAITQHFDGPPRNFILGALGDGPREPEKQLAYLIGQSRKYGLNYQSWQVMNNIQIAVTDPKDVESILTSKTSTIKGTIYSFMEPWLGKSILLTNGENWFNRRKINTPSFHFNILERFYEVFKQTNIKLIEKLNEKTGEFEIQDIISNATLDNISETAMGVKLNALDNPRSEYIDAIHEMSHIFLRRIFSLFHFYPTLYNLLHPDAKKTKEVVKVLHDFTDHVIEARKKTLAQEEASKSKLESEDPSEYGGKKRLSLLDMLLQVRIDGKPLPDEHIREEVDTFLFAGHDTTTGGITFCLYNLAKNQEIQEQLYQELVESLGKDLEAPVAYNDLQNLKYLDKVIKETLRITPPVPIITRKTVEEITIGRGVKIPPGIDLIFPIVAMHHNPKIFTDPDKFDPERFSEEEVQKRGPFDYVPFSAGQRNCIGQRFAMMEMKTMLAAILRNFKVLPTERLWNQKLQADLVLRPLGGGVYVKLEKRVKITEL